MTRMFFDTGAKNGCGIRARLFIDSLPVALLVSWGMLIVDESVEYATLAGLLVCGCRLIVKGCTGNPVSLKYILIIPYFILGN